MADIAALGELLIDFTPVALDSQKESGRIAYEPNPGGAPANVLASAVALGGSGDFIGMVGDDHFGRYLKDKLVEYGIGTAGLKFTGKTGTTLAFVHLEASGERSFNFYRNPGADTLLEEGDLPSDIIANARIFHFGSLSMTDEPARSATLRALRVAGEYGKIISYDPNWRPALWSDTTAAIEQMKSVLGAVDILKISEEEMELLTGKTDPETGSGVLADMGIRFVAVTMGAGGCFCRSGGNTIRAYAYAVRAIDTTGSGDAFMGALLYRMARLDKPIDRMVADEMKDIVDFANAAGGLCATKRGAMPAMPSLGEVEACRREMPVRIAPR